MVPSADPGRAPALTSPHLQSLCWAAALRWLCSLRVPLQVTLVTMQGTKLHMPWFSFCSQESQIPDCSNNLPLLGQVSPSKVSFLGVETAPDPSLSVCQSLLSAEASSSWLLRSGSSTPQESRCSISPTVCFKGLLEGGEPFKRWDLAEDL